MSCIRLSVSFLTLTLLFSGLLLPTTVFSADKSAPVTTPSAVEQRLANIERLLQSNGLLDMLQQIELLQQEVAKLRGEIEVNNHALDKMKNRQRDLYSDIDRRLQSLVNNSPIARSADTNPSPKPVGQTETLALTRKQAEKQVPDEQPKTGTESDTIQIQAEYQLAFRLLKQSQYDQAIKAFAKFLQVHPKNQYSDNAQYWMAEALYVKRQYEDAIREYNNLISNYPKSQKVPHGLLKIGYSYQELGKIDKAKLWYIDVKQRFPGTTASRLANDRLKNINDS